MASGHKPPYYAAAMNKVNLVNYIITLYRVCKKTIMCDKNKKRRQGCDSVKVWAEEFDFK